MTLEDFRNDMMGCSRCSMCKWIPQDQIKSWRYAYSCPSIARYSFHAFSGSGKLNVGLSILEGRSELNAIVSDVIYKCTLCGACEVSCKVYRDDIDLCEVIEELRALCVAEGYLLPEHVLTIDRLKQQGNMLGGPKEARDKWAGDLGLKDINREMAGVMLHAGCRFSYDEELLPAISGAARMLLAAGVDLGIAGTEEICCGVRAYEMGYQEEAKSCAKDMAARVKASGATRLVTSCSDCYSAFKYLYPKLGWDLGVEVLHITEIMDQLILARKLRFSHEVPMSVTYHDPCHLGRRSEPFIGVWSGDKLLRPLQMKRSGRGGVFQPPRNLMAAIPGLKLKEMERIREHSWCCGAGGGVLEAYPDFALWSATERLEEAVSTGADALVTACGWCVRNLRDAARQTGANIPIYDISELLLEAWGGE